MHCEFHVSKNDLIFKVNLLLKFTFLQQCNYYQKQDSSPSCICNVHPWFLVGLVLLDLQFVDRCLFFCTFSFGHCVVCPLRIMISPLVSSNSSYVNLVILFTVCTFVGLLTKTYIIWFTNF